MATTTWNSSFEATPAGTDAVSGGDDRIRELKTAIRQNIHEGKLLYVDGAGSANAYTATLAPASDTLVEGNIVIFKSNAANTGNSTLNVNGLGVKNILKNRDQTLAAGDIEDNQVIMVVYDGTSYQMISQLAHGEGGSVTAHLLPGTANTYTLGNATYEFADLFIGDNSHAQFGSDQDVLIGWNTTRTGLDIAATEGAALALYLSADEGDDAGDEWKLNVADGGTITLGNDINSAGTFVTHLTITPNSTVASSTVAFAGNITIAGTVNSTGTITGTLATAAQGNVTSLGTLTALTVDNIAINGTTIGHTGDTDLMTLASGVLTVAGEISVTTLDIGGTNVTSTAAELNLLDGSSAGSIVDGKAPIYASNGVLNATTLQIASSSINATAAEINTCCDGNTSATSTTLADADRVAVNDDGGMKQVALTDFETYFESALDTLSNVTSLGTLTTLTVDNVIINGTTIGHTSDTDLMTLASGVLTVAGEISVTTLDIGGTNVTSTAAELNLIDGSSANSVVNSKAVIYGSSGELAGTLSTAAQTNVTSLGTLTALTVDDVAINGDTITFEDGETITRAATDQMFFKTNGSTSGGKWQFNLGASNNSVFSMAQTGDGVGGTVVNEDGLDRDFRIETNDNANALVIDGGTNFMGFGAASSTSVNYFYGRSKAYTAAVDGDEYIAYILSNSNAITTAGSGTHNVIATLALNEPDITIGTAGVTNATTLLINNVATEATNNYALWINAGVSRFDGDLKFDTASATQIGFKGGQTIGDNASATSQVHFKLNNDTSGGGWQWNLGAGNYSALRMYQTGAAGVGETVFNQDGVDHDHRIESDDETHCLMVDGGLNNVAMCTSSPSYGGSDGAVFLGNANTNPDSNPTGGGVLYADSGALKYRGSSGTVTTIAAA